MKTRVHITVDVEAAEERLVRGRIQPPLDYDLRVWGRFSNHRDELGIPLLMNELERHGFKGTFFVDPFGSRSFGRDAFRELCQAIVSRGHDVQLHAHPVQAHARHLSEDITPPPDHIGAYPIDAQTSLLLTGIEMLVEAGVPRHQLIAFRAGHFGATNDTWDALARVGIAIDSSYNPCYFTQGCKLRTRHASADLFATGVNGVWELPVTCFIEALPVRNPYRHLQISAVSLPEIIHCLWQCHHQGIEHVTVVTHSFEMFQISSADVRQARLSTCNLQRYTGLLRFLSDHEGAFSVETVGSIPLNLLSAGPSKPLPRGTLPHLLVRWAEQAAKRVDPISRLQAIRDRFRPSADA